MNMANSQIAYRYGRLFLLLLVLRTCGGVLIYLWMHASTPFHRITPGHGPDLYLLLSDNLETAGYIYLVLYAVAGMLYWVSRRGLIGNGNHDAVLDTGNIVLLVVDFCVLYIIQVSTSGPMSVFRYGDYILIAFAYLTINSRVIPVVLSLLCVAAYYMQFSTAGQSGTWLDVLLSVAPMIGFSAVLYHIRWVGR